MQGRVVADIDDHDIVRIGVRHLLETHLVTEVFVVVTARQLHPDHPVSQLLSPHLRFTVALDCLARVDAVTAPGSHPEITTRVDEARSAFSAGSVTAAVPVR